MKNIFADENNALIEASIGHLKAYPVTSYQSDSVERHAYAMVNSVVISEGNCAGFQFTDFIVLNCLGCGFCYLFRHLCCNTSILVR